MCVCVCVCVCVSVGGGRGGGREGFPCEAAQGRPPISISFSDPGLVNEKSGRADLCGLGNVLGPFNSLSLSSSSCTISTLGEEGM